MSLGNTKGNNDKKETITKNKLKSKIQSEPKRRDLNIKHNEISLIRKTFKSRD